MQEIGHRARGRFKDVLNVAAGCEGTGDAISAQDHTCWESLVKILRLGVGGRGKSSSHDERASGLDF